MKIVILSDWFSENMGYIENCLPKALSLLGHEVHVVTSERQVYSNSPNYPLIYQSFLGPPEVETGITSANGFSLHRLPSKRKKGTLRISRLKQYISELKPDIVQTFDTWTPNTLEVSICQGRSWKVFTGCHSTLTTHRPPKGVIRSLKWHFRKKIPGKRINRICEKCYAVTLDARDIAIRYYGVDSKKCFVSSLGVDLEIFNYNKDSDANIRRNEFRKSIDISKNDLVVIYTGRFSEEKDPLLLARAIAMINRDGTIRLKGIFIGDGVQKQEIEKFTDCKILPFADHSSLSQYYNSSDIGVWPRQESTSQLDAIACGLPVIISNKLHTPERISGNGLSYAEGDCSSLVKQIIKLSDHDYRRQLGSNGHNKIKLNFSWSKIAKDREKDYQQALNKLSK